MVSAMPAQFWSYIVFQLWLCDRMVIYAPALPASQSLCGLLFRPCDQRPEALKMDRVKKFTGRAKGTPVVPVRRNEDESLVLFGELYKHEKERDMNLLEPMFSFSSKPDSASVSTTSGSPTSSSTKSVTPTARPSSSSSKKNLNREGPSPSKEQDSAYRMDKKSSYTPLTNRQHNSIPAAPATATTATKASKKTLGNKSEPSNAVKNVARPDKGPKSVTATTKKPRPKDSSVGAKDQKVDVSTSRRQSCPPSATTDNTQVTATTKGRSRAAAGVVPTTPGTTDAVLKGRRRAVEEKEQRPKLGSHAKK
ncbi:hypothetical protein U9M48_014918 [Paspalum notatum var. saurae]|uniref:Uncharacterized protein n=1 Tax=Paspalum notatum var. saurae TaxID=547442 RepID=A0AAQ3T333_PASNO